MPLLVEPAEAAALLALARERARQSVQTVRHAPPPLQWVMQHATIVLPTLGRVPFEPRAYQVALLEDASPRRLVLKARQTGLSNAIALEALYYATQEPDRTILLVSRNQDAARGLIRYAQHTMQGLPPSEMPTLVNENQSELAWANGSRIVSLPANPSTGRGLAATRVYLDEFAFCQYDDLIYESIIGTVSTGGSLTVLSTPNGRGNLFFRLWNGQEGGTWSRHSVHWSDCPLYTPEWAAAKQAEMPRQSFAQEYDLDFIASGAAVFNPDDLAQCSTGYMAEPDGCSAYVTAWDIGRRHDHTVGITLGQRGECWHVVAFERFLAPYPVIQATIEARVRQFPTGQHVVESNGPGDSVIENLAVRVAPFVTTAKSKMQAIQALQQLIEKGQFKYAEPQLDRELSLYQWDDSALVQDCVMAAALAAKVAETPSAAWEFY